MAGYGITSILCSDGSAMKKGKNNEWTANLKLNNWKEATKLLQEKETIKDFLIRIDKKYSLTFQSIILFSSNGLYVDVKKLYPKKKSFIVTFITMKESLWLLTIGAKTLNEIRAVGNDTNNESKVPLLVTSNGNQINLYL